MSEPTKGPWYCHGGSVYATQYPDCGRPIADMRRDETASKAGIPAYERDNNARLIAEAPAMLEVLRAVAVVPCARPNAGADCSMVGDFTGRVCEFCQTRAILRRIEG